jgi:hypothetical protein
VNGMPSGNAPIYELLDLRVMGVDLSVAAAHREETLCHAVRLTTTGQSVTGGPDMRLATYGTLAPGRPNNDQLSDLPDAGW